MWITWITIFCYSVIIWDNDYMKEIKITKESMGEVKAFEYCEETINVKKHIEGSYLVLCSRLHKIKEARLFEAGYETWGNFLEELHIEKHTAERMVKIYDTFVLKYGISPAKIEGAGGWSVVAELLPISNSKEEAEEALEYATGALKKDVRIFVHEKRYGKESTKMCTHEETYSVTICKDCGERWQVFGVEEVVKNLESLHSKKTTGYPEAEHLRADEIIVQFLRDLGYKKVAEAWEEVDKWYA